ncbi:methyltransferase domain-containing protein [Bradyrhizobium sp.]|uniref:class I SAM-dependent methyltransferase n=1 Tax=Bradyrhizobium sp. TaxID=376 RepID=UPI0025BA130D|nr:methyltransferase domain-containing protein [Bradyrhizobium sp.]
MTEQTIRFEDGAGYEQMMGVWSRLVGEVFLPWLAPPPGQRWIDVGCGNGAFTELLVDRCAPAAVEGIDPSEGQLAFARTRPAARLAKFTIGDAMALPFPAASFDMAVMALVLVFVPDPRKGVEEMVRVVRPGGTVATYMWDMLGGGFPLDPVIVEMRAMGLAPTRPPQMEASRTQALRDLWNEAGLREVATREITVWRTFENFDQLWSAKQKSPTIGPTIAALKSRDLQTLQDRVRTRLPADAEGRITYAATANAIKGRVPA